MTTITIETAQAQLFDLIGKLTPGEQVVIVNGDQPVARLIGESPDRPSDRAANAPDPAKDNMLADALSEFYRRLKAAGLLAETKSPVTGDGSSRSREPATIAGEPLSTTIINGRR